MQVRRGDVPVEGTTLHYEVTGEGPAVLLAHGRGLDLRMWDDQVPALAARYQVVRCDLRGFGKSPPADVPYRHADDLAALIAHLGLGRVAAVGLSMGGGAVVNLALLHPGRVRALVAVDASLGGFAWSREFQAIFERMGRQASERGGEAADREFMSSALMASLAARPAVAARVRAIMRDYSGWHWRHGDPGRPLVPPAAGRLREIDVPTLAVVGERDLPDFHAIADAIERGVHGARKVVMPGVGHMANMEDPEGFNRLLLGFLAGLDPRPAP